MMDILALPSSINHQKLTAHKKSLPVRTKCLNSRKKALMMALLKIRTLTMMTMCDTVGFYSWLSTRNLVDKIIF